MEQHDLKVGTFALAWREKVGFPRRRSERPYLYDVHSVIWHMHIEHRLHAWSCVQRAGTNVNKNNKVTVLKCLTREGTGISPMFQGGPASVRNAWAALALSSGEKDQPRPFGDKQEKPDHPKSMKRFWGKDIERSQALWDQRPSGLCSLLPRAVYQMVPFMVNSHIHPFCNPRQYFLAQEKK